MYILPRKGEGLNLSVKDKIIGNLIAIGVSLLIIFVYVSFILLVNHFIGC